MPRVLRSRLDRDSNDSSARDDEILRPVEDEHPALTRPTDDSPHPSSNSVTPRCTVPM
jgi:hypothetical protein